ECRERGATSVHIHPIEERTGKHKKDPKLYAKNAAGARQRVPGIVVNNDASLNSVGLGTDCTEAAYLRTRLAGLQNDSPPDVFTLFATNEALMVADTPGGYPRPFVEEFIRKAGKTLEQKGITALAEISQDPYGMRSVRRGLEILREEGITLPGLSFSFLVNGTGAFPAVSKKPLTYTDKDGVEHTETAKERFMRLVEEGVAIKHEFGLKGPLTFGTVVRRKANGTYDMDQDEVWKWVAEFVKKHPEDAREFGIVVKAGLEEWSGYKGQQVSNPDAVSIARSFMERQRWDEVDKSGRQQPLFETVTDINVMREWVGQPAEKLRKPKPVSTEYSDRRAEQGIEQIGRQADQLEQVGRNLKVIINDMKPTDLQT
ncbi:MAG: 3-keto-5-aminohexanoate cleavage protein, partial [Rickettsiales bacterium]|nr:3-keto-5-aminohexanoate cleavage protein [Rickettsiales bacterium]